MERSSKNGSIKITASLSIGIRFEASLRSARKWESFRKNCLEKFRRLWQKRSKLKPISIGVGMGAPIPQRGSVVAGDQCGVMRSTVTIMSEDEIVAGYNHLMGDEHPPSTAIVTWGHPEPFG